MDFAKAKERSLLKYREKVKAGIIDQGVIQLNRTINLIPDLYTTSSCAGRVIIISKDDVRSKYSTTFHFKTHTPDEILSICNQDFNFEDQLWFLLEAPNLHIMARTLKIAKNIQKLALQAKLGLSKFQSIDPNIIVEILGTSKMQLPLGEKGKFLVEKKYIEFVAKLSRDLLSLDQKYLRDWELNIREAFET